LTTLLGSCLLNENDHATSNRGDDLAITFAVIDKFEQPVDQFTQGEQATFRIQYHNKTDTQLSLDFTAPGYDVTVVEKDSGKKVWVSDFGRFYPQYISKFNMAPYETRTLDIPWDLTSNEGATPGKSNSGAPLPVGLYQAEFTGYYGGINIDLAPLDVKID
jgi:hypothetical protein